MVSIARLSVVKQSFFGLPGQYGRRVTRVNWGFSGLMKQTTEMNNHNWQETEQLAMFKRSHRVEPGTT